MGKAGDGDVIHLTDGQTHSTAAVTVSAGVTIIGGGDGTLISNSGAITLDHSDAVLKKVKITNTGANSSVAITLKKGTLDDCFVYNCRAGNAKHKTLEAMGGVVRNCRFSENHPGGYNGQGYEAPIYVTGPVSFNNCLFWGNVFPNGGACVADIKTPWLCPPGAVDVSLTSGTVTFENCTFAANRGHSAGAVRVMSANKGHVSFVGCVIAENETYLDLVARADIASSDICLNISSGSVSFDHCLIGQMPKAPNAAIVFTDCWQNTAAGFKDAAAKDFSLVAGSPAYGYGYQATELPSDFACAVATPVVDRGVGSLATTLTAKLFNAPAGDVTYVWDLDGDGTYETTDKGASFDHTFTTVGWNKVGLKATAGGETVEYVCDNFAYVAPETIFVAAATKTFKPVPTFPYATEDTAAATLSDALKAAIDGCVVKLMSGSYSAGGLSVFKKVELAGDDENLANVTVSGGLVIGDGVTAHGIKFSTGSLVLSINGDSVVTGCDVCSGQTATASTGTGLNIIDGLFVNGRIYGNRCNNGQGIGLYVMGGTVRNAYVYDNRSAVGQTAAHDQSPVKIAGGTVENCTIAKNNALSTASASTIGGVAIIGACTFRNNVVWGNTCASTAPGSANNWWVKSGVSTDGIYKNVTEMPGGLGTDCYTDNPQFAAIDTYDFSITSASGCYNKGANQDWMEGATDIAGNVRVQGGTVDIGAYEADASVVTLGMDFELLEGGVGAAKYRFRVTGEYGSLPADTKYAWDFDGDGDWDDYGLVVTHDFGEGTAVVTMQALDASDKPVGEPAVRDDIVDVKALTVFVSAASEAPVYPYNTAATAAKTLPDALRAAGSGSEVLVGEGKYLSAGLSLNFEVTIRGTGDRAKTIVAATPFASLMHEDALVENLTLKVSETSSDGGRGTGVTLTSGTLRNCLLYGFNGSTHKRVAIDAEDATAALIDGCEIRDCYNGNSDEIRDGDGGVVYLGGTAVMRNTLIWRTQDYRSQGRQIGWNVVYVGPSARMENCVVYGWATATPAVKNLGTVVNSIMLENQAGKDTSSIGAPNWAVEGSGVFANCISTVNGAAADAPEGIWALEPDFVDPANGDFHITSASVAFNAGLTLDWMAEAKDLYGNDRLSGAAVDIGVHEVDVNAKDLNIAASPLTGLGATEVTFTAVPNAFDLDAGATFKWYLKAEVEDGDEPDSTTNPFTTTLEPGVYSVSLFVTNADGEGTDYHRVKRGLVTITPKDIYIEEGDDFAEKIALASDGTTVHFGEGTFPIARPFTTTKAIAFVGAGMEKTVLTNPETSTNAILTIGNAGASVSGLAFANAGSPMLTVAAGGGTVEDVVFTGARDTTGKKLVGGALRQMGGTVRRCVFRDNASGARSQVPVFLGGETAVLESCLLTDNSSTGAEEEAAGALYFTRGTIRNCTVVGNVSVANAGGVSLGLEEGRTGIYSVALQNTIVWGNSCAVGSLYDNVLVQNAVLRFCTGNYTYPALGGGTANIGSAADPGFKDAVRGDYCLQYGAPARNKGLYDDWMSAALDLRGNPRSKDAARRHVDIGCYETGKDGLLLMVR